jgi:CRP-like cAMP-binding protein
MRRSPVLRSEAFVAHQELVQGLQLLGASESRPKDTILFREGEPSRGGYLLEEGEARLLLSRNDGRAITIRTVGPGYLMGLPGTILNRTYFFTAKLTRPSRVTFIPTDELLEFLRRRSDLCFDIVEMLGGELLDLPQAVLKRCKRSRPRTSE